MTDIDMLRVLGATLQSKFIYLRHQYLKQIIKTNNIEIKHIPSQELRADMFTKALDKQRFEQLRDSIDVAEIPNIDKYIMG